MSNARGRRTASSDWRASQFLWISLAVTALSITFFFAGRSIFNKMDEVGTASPEGVWGRVAVWGGFVVQKVSLDVQPTEGEFPVVEKIQRQIQPLHSRPIFSVDVSRLQKEIARSPWVQKVEVKRSLPSEIQVQVALRKPALALRAADAWIFTDQEGVFLFANRALPGTWIDLPRVFGLESHLFGDPEEMNRRLTRERGWLESLVKLLRTLKERVSVEVLRVDVREDQWLETALFELTCLSEGENFEIHLRANDWEERIAALQFVLSDLKEKEIKEPVINGIYPHRWYVQTAGTE